MACVGGGALLGTSYLYKSWNCIHVYLYTCILVRLRAVKVSQVQA